MKIAVLDFETADYGPDSACALGLVTIENTEIVNRKSFLIKPPRKNFLFTSIHGISWRDVCNSPTLDEFIPTLSKHLESVDFIAAHNAAFDRKILLNSYAITGFTPPNFQTVCTVKLSRAAWNLHPTTLPDVCKHFNISLNHHEALSDANACAEIVIRALAQNIPIKTGLLGPPTYSIT